MLQSILHRVALWLAAKTIPAGLTGNQWTGTSFVDSYKRNRQPTPNDLLAELKATAWTCASINAAVCASYPPRLFVTSTGEQPEPKCATKAISRHVEERLRREGHLAAYTKSARRIQEVVAHPLLDLLAQVNPIHNAFDLWELTTLYQEVHGSAYWYIERDVLGLPARIWILPSQNVTPRREPDSPNVVDYYEYRTGARCQRFSPSDCIHFRYPNPRDPYASGLSPLEACFEQVSLTSDYAALRQAKLQNRAIPDAIISAPEGLGEEERDRLERQWNDKFRRGGSGKVVIAETGLKVELLNQSMGDLAALADLKATKEDIANAFHVPLSMLSTDTNLANLQAAEHQHMSKAISPRLRRRDEKLNEQLIPLYDPSRRLFLASEDPIPLNREFTAKEKELDLKYGVVSINEDRMERGLEPVPWGWAPWLPTLWAQTDKRPADPGARNRDERAGD
jgi:HK97 family phage portal protein